MANDTYGAASGQGIYAGRFNRLQGLVEGGAVETLAGSALTLGFTLLTTAPSASVYRHNGHAGCAWDGSRKALYVYGAETHGTPVNYDNSLYVFDTNDGLFKKMSSQTSWPDGYNINEDGYLWADDAETTPWACHTYQSLLFDKASGILTVAIDSDFHSYTTPVQKGSVGMDDRKISFLQYDTATKKWSQKWSSDIALFLKSSSTNGVAYSDVWGYVCVDGVYLHRVSISGAYSKVSVYGKCNTQYHDTSFFIGDNFIKFGGNSNTTLCSIHPMMNIGSSVIKLTSDYEVLSGWSIRNKASLVMPDGRILFLAMSGTVIGAFIYDINLDLIVDTSYRLSGAIRADGWYDFKMAWSNELSAAIYISNMLGDPAKAYLLRINHANP